MAKKKIKSTKKRIKRQLRQGVDTMDNEKLTELFYENQRNIAVLGRDVESIKQDIKEFKDDSKSRMAQIDSKLEKLINEPQEDYKKFKGKVWSLVISAVAVLVVLGMGVWVSKITTEAKQITQQYSQTFQEQKGCGYYKSIYYYVRLSRQN